MGVYDSQVALAERLIREKGKPVNVVRQEILSGELVVLSDIATDSDKGYYLLIKEEHSPLVDDFITWFFSEVIPRD